jgi:simple sugar transport system permease protein
VAAIVIFVFFLIVAPAFRSADSFFTVLYQASTIGIVAVGVGMLMIGGEFDLSAGVTVTAARLVAAMFCYQLGINLIVGAVLASRAAAVYLSTTPDCLTPRAAVGC